MLERQRIGTWGETRVQRFAVAYDVPVVFTRDAFDPDNPTLVEALRRREPAKRHRVAVFVDEGVQRSIPHLVRAIRRYAAVHARSMSLAGDIVIVPGGEQAKSGDAIIDELLGHLAERGIDRHSFAVAIGGGAVVDPLCFAGGIFPRGGRPIFLPGTGVAA